MSIPNHGIEGMLSTQKPFSLPLAAISLASSLLESEIMRPQMQSLEL
jgi:hypothetical protein